MSVLEKPTGFRGMNEAEIENERLVRVFLEMEDKPDRRVVQRALRDVRCSFSPALPAGAWHLLDHLVDLSHDRDWSDGLIVVWPSNAHLMDFMGCGERMIQTYLRQLTDANLITHRDDSSRKRRGFRDAESGRILDAYGIDLRPLAARAFVLAEEAEEVRKRRALTRQLRSKINATAARIVEYLRTAAKLEPHAKWELLARQVHQVTEPALPKHQPLEVLEPVWEKLSELDRHVRQALQSAYRPKEKATHGQVGDSPSDESDCTLKTTNTPDSSNVETVPSFEHEVAADLFGKTRTHRAGNQVSKISWSEAREHLEAYKISPSEVARACPGFTALRSYALLPEEETWDSLASLNALNRYAMGVSNGAWFALVDAIGEIPATVALAVISEKVTRSYGQNATPIHKPGGYVMWFARAARDQGILDLGPKIKALLPPRKETA